MMKKMTIEHLPIAKIKPYPGNPRRIPQAAVDAVAKSIQEFGFLVPIVVDSAGCIIAGHTRHRAALQLKLQAVPCIRADGLTPKQVQAFRIADNSTAGISGWDMDALRKELADLDIDFTQFGLVLKDERPLAEQISETKEWTDTLDQAAKNFEQIKERLDKLQDKHPAAFAQAQAIVISDSTNAAIIISDPTLGDFLAELRRYSAAGDPSPLARILEATHPL